MHKNSAIITKNCFISRFFMVNRRKPLRMILILVLFAIFTLLFSALEKFFTRDIELESWRMNASRNTTIYVHPSRDTSLSHLDQDICSKRTPLVVIIVCSDTRNRELRRSIRETWAKDAAKYNFLVLFLVGISPQQEINEETLKESNEHRDIIVEQVIDSYHNLTIKSIFMLKWVHMKCMAARFLMKADDDSYINLANLYNYTSQVKEDKMNDFLVGRARINIFPSRFYFNKWYTPRYMYPEDQYPTYTEGACYLMSTYVAERLYLQSLLTDMIHLEDIYITGICAQQINITAADDPLFHFFQRLKLVSCNSPESQLIILGHYVDVYYMHKINDELSNC